MGQLFRTLQFFLLGAFTQFQPLTPDQVGESYIYTLQIGDQPYGRYEVRIDDASAEHGAEAYKLISEYLDDPAAGGEFSTTVLLNDSLRFVQQIVNNDGVWVEGVQLPSRWQAATAGFGGVPAFRAVSADTLGVLTAAGDSAWIPVSSFDYRGEDEGGVRVSTSESHGMVEAELYQQGTASVRVKLVPSE